jgi:hypothetical protein
MAIAGAYLGPQGILQDFLKQISAQITYVRGIELTDLGMPTGRCDSCPTIHHI